MERRDIESVVNKYISQSQPNDRYSSFDYCYNYFKNTNDLTKDIEKSCLALGFYLASWGMFRGSSFLLQKSIKQFQTTIEYITTLEKEVWDIDVDKYDQDNMNRIINIYREIKGRLIQNGNTDLTLITKIQLGVFGFIPAFDTYFCNTFRVLSNGDCGFRKVNLKSLSKLKDFYDANKTVIDDISEKTFTTDFISGTKTNTKYSRAKILDMYGFAMGQT